GYRPIKLGDHLKSGRYKVLHKLGWGGYSTVWGARDQRLYKTPLVRVSHANTNVYRDMVYVAIKICVAERDREIRELQTMKIMRSCHPRLQYAVHMLDSFDIQGPNGEHKCLVYGLLGPNIPDTINTHFLAGGSLEDSLKPWRIRWRILIHDVIQIYIPAT
ncbi:protein kinase, partial [Penicillium canescens]|uniref:protein kinase n=1 Tax=Penicillium canescens TaxID=5083 RepID=UPI0026E025C6